MVSILGKRFPTRVDFFARERLLFKNGKERKVSEPGREEFPAMVSLPGKGFFAGEMFLFQGMVYPSGNGLPIREGFYAN